MAIRTKITINGTDFEDYQSMKVTRSMSLHGTASTFQVNMDSPYGRHKDDFSVGNQIDIFADQDADPTTKIFTGIIEEVRFEGRATFERVILKGRDFVARLQDVTVEPSVFNNSEISTIVTSIIANEVQDITTNNVQVTDTTIQRIAFNHTTVYDALIQLAELAGFIFYIDPDKDLHFEQLNITDSGVSVDNSNILSMRFETGREDFSNQVWVYGDRYLSATPTEEFSAGSPFAGGQSGSVFTLNNQPHNTRVESSDFPGSILKGGIFQVVTLTSGPDYLVDFFDKRIIFVSGTQIGYSTIPTSGGSVIVNYDRTLPVVKFGENRQSIINFGPKEEIIVDKSIKDPITAEKLVKTKLELSNSLPNRIEIDVDGWFILNPGELMTVTLSDFNLNQKKVGILDIVYDFNKFKVESEQVIKIRLDKKVVDLTDKITDLFQRLTRLESTDLQDSDNLTRLTFGTGSLFLIGSYWEIRNRSDLGSTFLLGVAHHGVTGPTFGGILGSVIGSGINFLGDSRNELSTIASGGFNYATL